MKQPIGPLMLSFAKLLVSILASQLRMQHARTCTIHITLPGQQCLHQHVYTLQHAQLANYVLMLLSSCATSGDSKQTARPVFPNAHEHQPGSRALSEQHAIPEHLLTNKQAAALLSGIPAHLRAAKAQHRESILQLSEPAVEAEPGKKSCYVPEGMIVKAGVHELGGRGPVQ